MHRVGNKMSKLKKKDEWVLRSTYDDHWFDDVEGDCF